MNEYLFNNKINCLIIVITTASELITDKCKNDAEDKYTMKSTGMNLVF